MKLLYQIFDVNFNLPVTIQLYIFTFFLISTLILIIQIRPMLDKLYSKTPFYWFVGLIVLNILNIIFTIMHYNTRTGTFKGEPGDIGDVGMPGRRGQYTKCTKCDETISVTIRKTSHPLQSFYIDNAVGEIRRPTRNPGYTPIGDMIVTKDELKSESKKISYILGGPLLKSPDDYMLMATIPKIKHHTDEPCYIWKPIPPAGYIALGDIVTDNSHKPPKSATICVPEKCVKEVDMNDGFASYRFFYQNMREGKEEDYIFISFWDTPLNTFITNFPGLGLNGQKTFHNNNLFYNLVSGSPKYVKYNTKLAKHVPVQHMAQKLKKICTRVISPINLKGKRQNLGGGYFKTDNKQNLDGLWDVLIHYFPGGFDYMISVDSTGDSYGGSRLTNIQKKLIKFTQCWVMPTRPVYTLQNKCLTRTRIDHEKKEIIMNIKKLYSDFHYLLRKYGWEKPQLTDYLSKHFMRLKKQMRHIPDFEQKIRSEDFEHFGINRLKAFYKELQIINGALLNMTNEVPQDRRKKYFSLIRALKRYDESKYKYDQTIDDTGCKRDKDEILKTKDYFNERWDKIRRMFIGDKNYKLKLKNREFGGMTEDKIDNLIKYLNELSTNLDNYVRKACG